MPSQTTPLQINRAGLPSFVCVGGAKCGTTSLYEYLRAHPKVFLPDQKELHYFSYPDLALRPEGPGMRAILAGLISTEAAYRAQYARMAPGKIGGDVSPSYLNEKAAPARIKALLGTPKIIIMLRNPVERVHSQYLHLRRAAREPLSFEAALAAEDERVAAGWGDIWHYTRSAYAADRIERYVACFGRENVLLVLSDDLQANAQSEMARVYRFLGLPDDVPTLVTQRANRSGLPRSRALARLIDASPAAVIAKRILPRRFGAMLKRRVQELNTGAKEPLDRHLRQRLAAVYAEEIARIERLIGRSTDWRDGDTGP